MIAHQKGMPRRHGKFLDRVERAWPQIENQVRGPARQRFAPERRLATRTKPNRAILAARKPAQRTLRGKGLTPEAQIDDTDRRVIDEQHAAPHLHPVPPLRHDARDFRRAQTRVAEHHHIAGQRVAQRMAQRDHHIAHQQVGLHRARNHLIGRPDQPRQQEHRQPAGQHETHPAKRCRIAPPQARRRAFDKQHGEKHQPRPGQRQHPDPPARPAYIVDPAQQMPDERHKQCRRRHDHPRLDPEQAVGPDGIGDAQRDPDRNEKRQRHPARAPRPVKSRQQQHQRIEALRHAARTRSVDRMEEAVRPPGPEGEHE